jgi:hypothetical protein
MTRTQNIQALRRIAATLCATFAAIMILPGAAHAASGSSYGWPVKPFDRQHPVRGFFGDPRIPELGREPHGSFHFGVDVSCPDGTPVYATVSGTAVLETPRPETVAIRSGDGHTVHAYWHIVPAIRDGQRVVAFHTVVGHVKAPWGHVHFSELRDGVYLNPLRAGAMGPYRDGTTPVIRSIRAERGDEGLPLRALSGRFDIVAEVADRMPLAAPAPWTGFPVMPSVVRWRLVGPAATEWHFAVDFRSALPRASMFRTTYTQWTRQNHPGRQGRYRVLLAHNFDSRSISNRGCRLEIEVVDTGGNHSTRVVPLRVASV